MTPPSGFHRAHRGVAAGTWSDDGAQALCLLDSIITCGKFDLKDFSDKLLSWYQEGKWAVDGMVFDIGIQTSEALMAYKSGMAPEKCGMVRPDGKGNGALMRTLPLALWHNGTDKELVIDAHSQCLITHGNICNQVCCALYCLVARSLLKGLDFDKLWKMLFKYCVIFIGKCQNMSRNWNGVYGQMSHGKEAVLGMWWTVCEVHL